jgi:hypothetical protein
MTTKEFEKQTLDQLLIDLKDIDNYKSFRKGAFVYDLGHYQGQLLINEIFRLNNIIDELEKYLKKQMEYYKLDTDYYVEYKLTLDKLNELKGDNK